MRPFFRFVLLSGGGWLLDCGLLLVLYRFGIALGPANFVSSATAAVTVFILSRLLVFDAASDAVLSRIAVYFVYQVFAIFVVSLLIGPLAELVRAVVESAGARPEPWEVSLIGKILVTPPQLTANFLVSRFLVQHSRRPATHG